MRQERYRCDYRGTFLPGIFLAGRARDKNGMRDDPRNYLYVQYGIFLKKYSPKLFIFENVTGLLSAENGKYFRNIQSDFRSLGYVVEPIKVNANEFGVLQNRKRVIIIGWKKDINFSFDQLKCQSRVEYKVGNIFNDLPKLSDGKGKDKYYEYAEGINDYLSFARIRNGLDVLTQHIARPHTEQDKEIYRIAVRKWKRSKERLDYNDLPEKLKTHKNRHTFLDRFKVVADDVPCSQTVVAHIAKDGHYYIHPDIAQNRSISVREAARLQSFPDDYYFEVIKEEQNRTLDYRQIVNAAPPLIPREFAA
ncbi:MAG: DNA (cytosine-5-)-methyltransferase [Candidatus Brocadiaceae bacterium]|nr:DNA (cytosine-5-)-methyltransferase [Candidatus Brocadiaceae bacterium]